MVSPVPADIDVANSVEPFHISDIAKELNLSPTHYDLYGKYKAKVMISYVVKLNFSTLVRFIFYFYLDLKRSTCFLYRFCYLYLMNLKDLEVGITLWWEGLLPLPLEKASLLLLLVSVKLWELFLIKR